MILQQLWLWPTVLDWLVRFPLQEEVLPQVVTTRDSGYKAVKYEKIVPLLIEAIKEQQKQIDELQKQINYLVDNKT